MKLAAICWAACGEDPGFTPLSLLSMLRRFARMTGLGAKAALLQSVGIGITNLDRCVRLHRVARYLRMDLLHRALRDRAGLHLRLHRRARDWAGHRPLFFCGMMVLELVWVRTMVPETKGVPLEEIQRRLGVEA